MRELLDASDSSLSKYLSKDHILDHFLGNLGVIIQFYLID